MKLTQEFARSVSPSKLHAFAFSTVKKSLAELFDKTREDYSVEAAAQKLYDMAFIVRADKRLNEAQTALVSAANISEMAVGGRAVRTYEWNRDAKKSVLLVHGFGGRCLDFDDSIQRLIAQGHRVVGFDAPAHGFSEGREADIGDFWSTLNCLQEEKGNQFDLALCHSFGSAALTYQMRLGTVSVKNLLMFAPNATYDPIILGYIRLCKADVGTYPRLCDMVAERFASRIDRHSLWNANSTIDNIRTLLASRTLKQVHLLHGSKDNMFDQTESYAIFQVCENAAVPCSLHVSDSGHREVLSDAHSLNTVHALGQSVFDGRIESVVLESVSKSADDYPSLGSVHDKK